MSNDNESKQLQTLFREMRTRQNKTLEQMAEEFGVSHQTISSWESGKHTFDSVSLVKFLKNYDPSLNEFKKIINSPDSNNNLTTLELIEAFSEYYVDNAAEYLLKEPEVDHKLLESLEKTNMKHPYIETRGKNFKAGFHHINRYDFFESALKDVSNEYINSHKELRKRIDDATGRALPTIPSLKGLLDIAPFYFTANDSFDIYDEVLCNFAWVSSAEALKSHGFAITGIYGGRKDSGLDVYLPSREKAKEFCKLLFTFYYSPTKRFSHLSAPDRCKYIGIQKSLVDIADEMINLSQKADTLHYPIQLSEELVDLSIYEIKNKSSVECIKFELLDSTTLQEMLEMIENIGAEQLMKELKNKNQIFVISNRNIDDEDYDKFENYKLNTHNGFNFVYIKQGDSNE